MELCEQTQQIESILSYPETRDVNYFDDEAKLTEFVANVKKFAFPYHRTLRQQQQQQTTTTTTTTSSLVQFYTFVFTDANRIRQYGFCRSSHGGNHILCMISYLPWYNVFIGILNKISTIINEREVYNLKHWFNLNKKYVNFNVRTRKKRNTHF